MAQVLDITGLLGSAQSPDAAVRNAAEVQLKQFEESQYASFMLSLAAELGASDKPVDSRRLAGLLLKNALDAKDSARQVGVCCRVPGRAGLDRGAGPGAHAQITSGRDSPPSLGLRPPAGGPGAAVDAA